MGTHAQETSVKWFWSGMQGAPATGSLKAIFEACLINGFNQLTADSLVIDDGVATLTRASGHGYLVDSIINISGVTSPAGINGDHRVLTVNTTTVTFDAASFADETATGTVVVKQAPVGGWTMPYASGDKFVLRSGSPSSPRSYYRFSNDGTSESRSATAYELMSSVDSGTNQWSGNASDTQYYVDGKSPWMLWADQRTVYWAHSFTHATNQDEMHVCALGDFISFLAGDQHAELLQLMNNDASRRWGMSSLLDDNCRPTTQYGSYAKFRRPAAGTIGGCYFYPLQQSINTKSGYSGITFPSPVNNAIVLQDILLRETGGGDPLRGRVRGLLWVLNDQPLNNQWPPQTVEGVAGMEGRVLQISPHKPNETTTTYVGRFAIDITGPWEA